MQKNSVLITYPGYANETKMIVTGHLLQNVPKHWFSESSSWWKNAMVMIRLFNIKSVPGEKIKLSFFGNIFFSQTDDNGFFRFEVNHIQKKLTVGKHNIEISWLTSEENGNCNDKHLVKGFFIYPSVEGNGIITDVDDTLMISHSQSLIKKMFTLLTKTPQQRRIFNDAVSHYNLLAKGLKKYYAGILFLAYLSSSEWNLYPFIREFCRINQLPTGIYILRTIKLGFFDLLKSGSGNHAHKLRKIAKLIRFYPEMSFILLGDDRQKDPEIYSRIAHMYPKHIACIYIRKSTKKRSKRVTKILADLNDIGVPYLYYGDSKEAIYHSIEIGLIDKGAFRT